MILRGLILGLGCLFVFLLMTTPSHAQAYTIKARLASQPEKVHEAPCLGNPSTCAATLYIPFEQCADAQLTLGFKMTNYKMEGLFLCGKRLLSTKSQGHSYFYTDLKYDGKYEHSLDLFLIDPAFEKDSSALAVIRPSSKLIGNIALTIEMTP